MKSKKKNTDEKEKKPQIVVKVIITVMIEKTVEFLMNLLFGGQLPQTVFFIFFIIILCGLVANIVICCKKTNKCQTSYDGQIKELKMNYSCEKDNKKMNDPFLYYRNEKRKLNKERHNEITKIRICWWPKIFTMILIGILFCVSNPNNAKAAWDGLIYMAKTDIAVETEQEDYTNPEENTGFDLEPEETEMQLPESTNFPKPPGYRFVLEEPNKELTLDTEIEEQVFFLDQQGSGQNLDEYVAGYMEKIYACQYAGVDYTLLHDGAGNTYFTYTAAEDTFKKEVDFTQNELYYADWRTKAPKSSEMEKYIDGRESLNAITVDGEQGCYELWWKLANDYQYYAQEYEQQTNNKDAILYYYSMSVFCCMEALKYNISEEKQQEIYHYMVMRYHDMCRDDAKISITYKKLSQEIYDCLVLKDSKRLAARK